MPEITEQQLETFKKGMEDLEAEKSKVSALLAEKEELSKKIEESTKKYDELVLENTKLRNLNGKLLLEKENPVDETDDDKKEKSIEEEVLDILNGGK